MSSTSSRPIQQWLSRSLNHRNVSSLTSRSSLCPGGGAASLNPGLLQLRTLYSPSCCGLLAAESTRSTFAAERLQLRRSTRSFQSASDYDRIADESLDSLQDALDDWMEDNNNTSAEVVFASGVLTLKLPPHGTWVINKQSATQQIWWSSPLSGPKRFEYADSAWWSTKDGLNMNSQLAQELHRCFPNASELAVTETN